MRTPKRLTTFARLMRREPTDAERKMWYELRDRRFGERKFRRQYLLAGYILDFYCLELRLCLELDGGQHYDDGPIEQADVRRSATLAEFGVTVLRFDNVEFLKNTRGCMKSIEDTITSLVAQGPHPSPLPAYRERGSEIR